MEYYLLITICFLAHYIQNSIRENLRNTFKSTITLLIAIFLCFGYMTGTDWRTYENSYQWITFDKFLSIILFWEPGFIIYTAIFHLLEIDFWIYLIFTKLLTFSIFYWFLNKYSEKRYYFLIMTFFVTLYGLYFWIDNPLRNLIAFSIFLLSIPAILEKNKWKYFSIIFIAITFHYSSILLIPLYWILSSRIKSKTIIIFYIIFSLIFLDIKILFSIINTAFSWFPIITNKIVFYSQNINEESGKIISFGYLIHNIFFIILLLSRKKIETIKYGHFIFNSSILYIFLFRLGLSFNVFMRIAMYFALIYSISVIYILYNLENKSKIIYQLYLLLIITMITWSSITKDSRYIPYSSYLSYIFREKPSYYYRYYYNDNNSSYPRIYQ